MSFNTKMVSFLLDSEWQPFDKFLLLSFPSGTFQHGLSPLSCSFFVPPSLDNIRKKIGYKFRRK